MNLSVEETDLFYKLHGALLAYANRHLKILPNAITGEQIRREPLDRIVKLRDALHAQPKLLERFVAENPEQFSDEELTIIASWRHAIHGDFYIMRHLKRYSVFMGGEKNPHLYGVLGLYDPLPVLLKGLPLPTMAKAVLLPFRDCIIYDGIISSYAIHFGRGFRAAMNQTYNRLKKQEGIIEQLVGPTGEPHIRTSLARKAPTRPVPDWRPEIDQIMAQVEKMRHTETQLQSAAFGLLRAAASLAQATLQERDVAAEATRRLRSVRKALTKLERLLREEE